MKTCRVCKESKPLSAFGNLANAPDGLNYMCKPCNSTRSLNRYYADKARWLARQAERRQRDRDRVREIELASQERHRVKNRPLRADRQIRRSRAQKERTYLILPKELRRLYSQPCFACGVTKDLSIDHRIPLSRGGRHSDGNLMTLCRSCNASKHARFIVEWRRAKTPLAA